SEYLAELATEIAEMVAATRNAMKEFINTRMIITLSRAPSVGLMFFDYGMAKKPKNDIAKVPELEDFCLCADCEMKREAREPEGGNH
ncbi:31962_t:CDS:2, partial [Racocetra persica]